MAKSIHMLYKNIEAITTCVQHIRCDLVSVHGIPSDHFASIDMTMALNSLLEAKRIIKHVSVHGDNELSAHTIKFMKSIVDDVIWGVSSVQHHVDRDEHRFDSVTAAIFDSINELNEHIFCVDTVYSVSPVTHDIEVATKDSESGDKSGVDVSDLNANFELNESEKTIFDELVATLFERPAPKLKGRNWSASANPLLDNRLSGLVSRQRFRTKIDAMVEKPYHQPFLKTADGERVQIGVRAAKRRTHETRPVFGDTQPLLSGFPVLDYHTMMMDVLTAAVVTFLNDEESTVTVEDWHMFVENVNSKL